MISSLKRIFVWSILFMLLDYYMIFVMLLNSCLSLVYYEYQSIFKKICYSQTGPNEEKYIERLSSSVFPYILNQLLLSAASFSGENPERILCICVLVSTIVLATSRIRQYSIFCLEETEVKRKEKKTKTKEEEL